jgi:hypothetical protein
VTWSSMQDVTCSCLLPPAAGAESIRMLPQSQTVFMC